MEMDCDTPARDDDSPHGSPLVGAGVTLEQRNTAACEDLAGSSIAAAGPPSSADEGLFADTCTLVSSVSTAIAAVPMDGVVDGGLPSGCQRCAGNHEFAHTCSKRRARPKIDAQPERSSRRRSSVQLTFAGPRAPAQPLPLTHMPDDQPSNAAGHDPTGFSTDMMHAGAQFERELARPDPATDVSLPSVSRRYIRMPAALYVCNLHVCDFVATHRTRRQSRQACGACLRRI